MAVPYTLSLNTWELAIPWSSLLFTGIILLILCILFMIACCCICCRSSEIRLQDVYTRGYLQAPADQQRILVEHQQAHREGCCERYCGWCCSPYSYDSYYDGMYYRRGYYSHPYLFPNCYCYSCYCGSCNTGNCCRGGECGGSTGCGGAGKACDCCDGPAGSGNCGGCGNCGSCNCGKCDCNCSGGGSEGLLVVGIVIIVLIVIAVLMINILLLIGVVVLFRKMKNNEPTTFYEDDYAALYKKYIASLAFGIVFGLALNIVSAWTFGIGVGFLVGAVYLPCFLLAAMGIFSTDPSIFRSFSRLFMFYYWIPAFLFMNLAYFFIAGSVLHWILGWFLTATTWFIWKIVFLLILSSIVLYAGIPSVFGARGMRNILRSQPGLPAEFDDGRGFPVMHITIVSICVGFCIYFTIFWWDYPNRYSWSIWGGILGAVLVGSFFFLIGLIILAPNTSEAKPLMVPPAQPPPSRYAVPGLGASIHDGPDTTIGIARPPSPVVLPAPIPVQPSAPPAPFGQMPPGYAAPTYAQPVIDTTRQSGMTLL